MKANTEERAPYGAEVDLAAEEETIRAALLILARRLGGPRECFSAPGTVRDYLRLYYRDHQREEFDALWLDAQNRLIRHETLFVGTLTQTSVYPREVVKAGLAANAAGVILAHNHPSGIPEPSRSDEALTQCLKQALALVDVKVLDHFIAAGNSALSFAERGLL